jgi:hypothetical protein
MCSVVRVWSICSLILLQNVGAAHKRTHVHNRDLPGWLASYGSTAGACRTVFGAPVAVPVLVIAGPPLLPLLLLLLPNLKAKGQ